MKCLIIAAGKGHRLRSKGDSKPLVPLFGIPLIERVIRCALKAGADDFFVVTGYQGEGVRVFLDRLAERLGIGITPIVNEDGKRKRPFGTQGAGFLERTLFVADGGSPL